MFTLKDTAQDAVQRSLAEMQANSAPQSLEDEVITLFDLYREPVLRYVISSGIPIADAEEVVQGVFLALFRHLRAGKSRTNLAGWIFTVAHNMALKRRSSERRRSRYFQPQTDLAADSFESPLQDPEAQLSSRQECARVSRIVRALPEQDRNCLALRAEGLRYRDIARILGVSLGSVAGSLSRALTRLSAVKEVSRR